MESKKAIIINPNIGHPLLLNIDNKLETEGFNVNLLFVSNIKGIKDFEIFVQDKIFLVPILEYKWKLLSLLEKELSKIKRKRLKGVWRRIKRVFSRKEAEEEEITLTDSEGKVIDVVRKDKLLKLKPKPYRGDRIKVIASHVQSKSISKIDAPDFDDYYSPREYLIKQDILGDLNKFYEISISFTLSPEVMEFLQVRTFVMFDLFYETSTMEEKVNYHAITITKNDWKDIYFIHATDLHLAERNDRIYEIVKKWMSIFRREEFLGIAETTAKAVSFFQRLLQGKMPIDKKPPSAPLQKRLVNPNNNFRKFIRHVNRLVYRNEIDFVVITGDIIDFTVLSKIPKDARKVLDFDYDQSNWKIFKEILLNFPQTKRRGTISGEEILCPIFTIPGNHDYRPFHYDLRWGNLYKKIGLTANEALALNDEFVANPISAITKSFRALKAYLTEVNASLDFMMKLGSNNFIFLNSGSDSFRNIIDFVSGHPSVTGLSSKQISYLENLINYKINDNETTYLFLHGPPINPKKNVGRFSRRGLKKSAEEMKLKIDNFKESVIQKVGKKLSFARIDNKFDVKFGTISSNWERLMNFCNNYSILTLTGHTHKLKEFRLENQDRSSSELIKNHPVSLDKIDGSPAIYYDDYSNLYSNSKEIEMNGPFVVQTPALGLGGYNNPKLAGGFREIIINNGKLTSFKVKYINK